MSKEHSNQSIILSELSALRNEMNQLRELVSRNVSNLPDKDSSKDVTKREKKTKLISSRHNPHFVFEFHSDGLNEETKSYLTEIFNVQIHPLLQGLNHNLSRAFNELGESFTDLEHEKERIKNEIHNAINDISGTKRIIKLRIKPAIIRNNGNMTKSSISPMSENDIPDFVTKVPEIMKALAHENKIKLLQVLRTSDLSQGELAELTGIKGGTFKNHMDTLLDIHFVQQSEVRGNYYITTLGVEALSYAEMLYKRSKHFEYSKAVDPLYIKEKNSDYTLKEE